MTAFKSSEGKRTIQGAVRAIYAQCPVPAESRMLKTGVFGETHALVTGPENAPPLVMIHGTSSNSATWFGYFPVLARLFRIYAVDMPGQPGLSDERRPPLNADAYSRWLAAVAAALDLERFHLCGRSMGGLISLKFAMTHPGKLASLALLAPGGLAPPRLSFFFRILPWVFLGKTGTRRINRIIHGRLPVDPNVEAFSVLVSRHFIPVTDRIPVFPEEDLKRIDCPVYYAGGEKDAMLRTSESAERLRRIRPDAEVHVLEGVGHVILDDGEGLKEFFLKNSVAV